MLRSIIYEKLVVLVRQVDVDVGHLDEGLDLRIEDDRIELEYKSVEVLVVDEPVVDIVVFGRSVVLLGQGSGEGYLGRKVGVFVLSVYVTPLIQVKDSQAVCSSMPVVA